MKIRGSAYHGRGVMGSADTPLGLTDANIIATDSAGTVVGTAMPDSRGEWSMDLAGSPGTGGKVRITYLGRTRELFIGDRDLGFGPSWDKNWPVTLTQIATGSTVRNGVCPDGERLVVTKVGAALSVAPGAAISMGSSAMWVSSFASATSLNFTTPSYNATTKAFEFYGSGEPAGGWVVGVERIPSTEQTFLTIGRKNSTSSTSITTPNGTYSNPLTGYDANFIALAQVSRSGGVITSITQVTRFLGEGRFHRRAPEIYTASLGVGEVDTTGLTATATSQTFVAGQNYVGRLMFRGDLFLPVTAGTTWELQATYGPTYDGTAISDIQHCATDASGKLYVCDNDNDRVVIINTDGSYYGSITGYNGVSGVCVVQSTGDIFVAYRHHSNDDLRMGKINSALVGQWTILINSNGFGTNDVAGICTDGTHVWICDTVDEYVYKYDLDGYYIGYAGAGPGTGNGQFSTNESPRCVVVDSTYFYASDPGNSRIQKFNKATGAYVSKWSTNANVWGLSIDSNGYIVAVDGSALNTITRYTTTGVVVDSFSQSGATGVAVGPGDVIWVTNADTETIEKWDQVPTGAAGWENLRVKPDISINGVWQALNFGDATHGAYGYGGGWGTGVVPTVLPFRGVSSANVTISAGDIIGARVKVTTTTGTTYVHAGSFGLHLLDTGSW